MIIGLLLLIIIRIIRVIRIMPARGGGGATTMNQLWGGWHWHGKDKWQDRYIVHCVQTNTNDFIKT